MATKNGTRIVQLVLKVSKLCNLRCRYCYEFGELAQREHMKLEQLENLYRHVAEYYSFRDSLEGERTEIHFIWHGGEPLLLRPDFYWQTFRDQERLIDGALLVKNLVQTNLTALDDARVELLGRGFDHVGVSVDLFGELRVTKAGKDSQGIVLRNMERLIRSGVDVACITVLTRENIGHLEKIFRFYQSAGLSFRVLPLFEGAFEGQHEQYDLTSQEILEALCRLVDLWLDSDGRITVTPIVEHIAIAARLFNVEELHYYDRRRWIPVLLVNTNGDVYGYGDPYGRSDWSYGNIFSQPLSAILSSAAFERATHEVERRLAHNCLQCRFFGACSGYPIAEDHTNCREKTEEGVARCVVESNLYEYIEQKLSGFVLEGDLDEIASGEPTPSMRF